MVSDKSLASWIRSPFEKAKPFLTQIPREAHDFFILKAKIQEFDAGDNILVEGTEGKYFFVLQSGRAQVCGEVYKGQTTEVAVLEKGSCFGEMSLITDDLTSNTILALEDCTVLLMEKPDFIKFVSDNPGVLILLYKIMADRLRAKNQAYSNILRTSLMGHGKVVPVVDVAQTFEKNAYTATLFVNNDEEGGYLSFKNGQMICAQVGGIGGADALGRILSWGDDVFFRVDETQMPDSANLPVASTTSLILDAMRYIDEASA